MIDETKMFNALRGTGVADMFTEYLNNLLDELCDIRNMKTHNEAELNARVHLNQLIQKKVINKIKPNQINNKQNPNKYL